jgi:hypothetical protein
MSIKISNDTIGNRTRDLPACSTVPHVRVDVIKDFLLSDMLDIKGTETPAKFS